jgi:hypothetical protein
VAFTAFYGFLEKSRAKMVKPNKNGFKWAKMALNGQKNMNPFVL